ncbi:thymidylate kinase [Cryptosporangium phraense]|uniref:Thymidylate kinase n=1 Tax=Cryptosporangium phraense TaxID=2593070 RepID=A0A545AN78_9ACTN|nr:thymidylate kinase [Cryptosporangium phraense]TQS42794.1 thymidylate kinase [Cryptosporangium phraense]
MDWVTTSLPADPDRAAPIPPEPPGTVLPDVGPAPYRSSPFLGPSAPIRPDCARGPLISIDGITGVGKTYLTHRVLALLEEPPLLLDGFSQREDGRPGLGEALLRALYQASAGDPFLRGGTPLAETLLLLAIKRHDFDTVLPGLSRGCAVLEGRSVDSTAVCQALLLDPDDADAALDTAIDLLELAASYRPLPDLTILVTDDADQAVERAQRRDQRVFTSEQGTFMRRAGALFEQVAAADPARYRVVDRRHVGEQVATELIRHWILGAGTNLACVRESWQDLAVRCIFCGRRTGSVTS